MKILELLANRAARAAAPPQNVQAAVVLGTDAGRYRISLSGQTTLADCGIPQRLKVGDRVWAVVGHGTAKIIGILGQDESAV